MWLRVLFFTSQIFGSVLSATETNIEPILGIVNPDTNRSRVSDTKMCTTPKNETGTCIPINSCEALYNQIRTRGNEASLVKFIRDSRCDHNQSTIHVCCATNSSGISSRSTSSIADVGDNKLHCGRQERNIAMKVVGGTPAELGAWPWMTALYCTSKRLGKAHYQCGGSLISNEWVLTAAHCLTCSEKFRDITLTHVRIGDLDLNDNIEDNATYITVQIKKAIPHPQYTRTPMENDIALLQLSQPVELTRNIEPICLPSGKEYLSENFYHKKRPFIIGWGFADSQNSSATHLFQTNVPIINTTRCIQSYSTFTKEAVIDDKVMCAGDGKHDSCSGDSGGPMMFPDTAKKAYYLGGIVSFGVRCAEITYPGVYTKVAAFIDWINNSTGLKF